MRDSISAQVVHRRKSVNKVWTTKRGQNGNFRYADTSSLKELKWTPAGASWSACKLQDNPRRLGKGRARLVGAAPLKPERKFRERRQDSPVPLAAFARCQLTRKRNLAVRSDKKPFRAGSSSSGRFRAWVNRSYPEGNRLLLCISTGRKTLADSINRLKPPNEKRRKADKRSGRTGKTTQTGQVA